MGRVWVKSVGKGYGESPIRVLRRSDIAAVRVTLSAGSTPILFPNSACGPLFLL
jgi:hypothetical protein